MSDSKCKVMKKQNNYELPSKQQDGNVKSDQKLLCGYFWCTPKWLQFFSSPKILLACISWFTFTQGFIINGIIYSNFTSWERRFGFSGTQLAWIASSYDAIAALFTIVISYIGQSVHNGRILSIGAYSMALGSFLMTLPHFIDGEYKLGPKPIRVCEIHENSSSLEECSLSSSSYYEFFIIAQCLNGIGGAALYSLSVPYMDGQIKTKNTPIYIGIAYGHAALGPAIGFILGGVFISYYVDINFGINPGITPYDPRWVGAWWIGILVSGFACLTVGFLVGCFPRELPSAQKNKAERASQAHKGRVSNTEKPASTSFSIKNIYLSLKSLMKNSVWVLLTIATTFESLAISGLGAFIPKIMQFQFALDPSRASLFSGVVIVPGAAGGYVIGGLIARCFKSKMKGLIIQSLVCSVIGICVAAHFLIRCDTIPVAGVTVPYHNSSLTQTISASDTNVLQQCNQACNCTTESYDPVCGPDNVEYFTPCHAGCLGSYPTTINGSLRVIYTNCSCVTSAQQQGVTQDTTTGGICSSDCTAITYFLPLLLLLNLATFISSTSAQSATIRCVSDKERGFAYGMHQTVVRVLGSVPGPIILGAIFDYACLIYQEACDITGSCWIYDTNFISKAMFISCVCVKSMSALCFIFILCLYKPPQQQPEETVVVKTEKQDSSDNAQNPAEIDATQLTHI